MKERRIDICQSCGDEAEIAAHGLCFRCYRRVERQAAYDKAGWNPGDTRRQKRLARAHGKLIDALLDFGAGTHPNAERLVGFLAAELFPLAEFLGTDVNSEQQDDVHVHPAPVLPGDDLVPADSEQSGGVHVHSADPEPEAKGEGGDCDVRVNNDGCSRSQETGDTNGEEPSTLIETKAGVGEPVAASGSDAVLGGYPVPDENVNSDQAYSRLQKHPSALKGSLEAGGGNDPDHAAGYGVALDCAEDDAVDYWAFKPAVAVGNGNGGGCEPPQEDVPGCKVPVPEQEEHGTDSPEVMEVADAGGLPPATPGARKRAKHLPVPIVLEDGRHGHVIAGMGNLTKRTKYDVRLETGYRMQVHKKLYAAPANLSGLCLVPKAWLVDGEAPLEKVPDFLKGHVPAQGSGGGQY